MRFTLLSSVAFFGLALGAAVPMEARHEPVPAGAPAPAPGTPGAPGAGVVGHIPTGVGKDGHPCGGRDQDGLVKGLLDGVNTLTCEGLPETLDTTVGGVDKLLNGH